MKDFTVDDERLLVRLRNAGAHLADTCRLVLQNTNTQHHALICTDQADELAMNLAAAIADLRELLQQVPRPQHAVRPTATQAAAPGRCSGATLLQLPDDLLRRIGRLAGKPCRSVCARLRDTYGPPGPVVRQPSAGFGSAEASRVLDSKLNAYSSKILKQIATDAIREHGSRLSLAAVRSCSARWSGWAEQVTRLELDDTYAPDAAALTEVQQALPALRELVLATTGVLPVFAGATRLRMLCSTHNLATGPMQLPPVRFGLLAAVPNVRSLHLDLRFQRLGQGHLQQALPSLAQLTHLELVWSPDRDQWQAYREDHVPLVHALASVADRLQSLVFLTPAHELDYDLQPVLQRMTRLTSLGWCTHWDTMINDTPLFGSFRCLLVPSLRQLVLGASSPQCSSSLYGGCDADAVADTLASAATGVGAGLRTLVLPPVAVYKGDEASGAAWDAHRLLGAVVDVFPGLTSLRAGFVFEQDLSRVECEAPEERVWLPPVARLRQLRRLVLTMNADEVGELACLAGLPALGELWLRLKCELLLAQLMNDDPGYQPGEGLVQLTSLQRLALRTTHEARRCPEGVQPLVAAAAGLPGLQMLDLSAANSLEVFEGPLLALAAAPPPSLREVVLPGRLTHSWLDEPPAGQPPPAPVDPSMLAARMTARLPSGVAVTVSGDTFAEHDHCWGPQPWPLAHLAHQLYYSRR